MRTVLVTGAGGAGRTTVAAATALAEARSGRRTLLLTTDRLGSAEAALGVVAPRGGAAHTAHTAHIAHTAHTAHTAPSVPAPRRDPDDQPLAPGSSRPWTPPVEAAPGLWAARVDSGEHFRTELLALQERCATLLGLLGARPLDRDELTELPGAPQLALLHALKYLHEGAAESARPDRTDPGAGWDVVVVDLPPVTEAVALVALPEQLRRYLRRLLPPERQAARALRPVLAQLAGVPMPAELLYEVADRCADELATAQAVFDDVATCVRLVIEPGPAAAGALRIARAGLALHGLPIDAVIANRLLPTGSTDPWLAGASGRQQAALKALHEEQAGEAAVCELPHLGREPRGCDDLGTLAEQLAEQYARRNAVRGAGRGATSGTAGRARGSSPDGCPVGPPDGASREAARERAEGASGVAPAPTLGSVEDHLADQGVLVWSVPLPGARRDELELVRRGDELVLGVGPFRRILPLPSALRRCSVFGAGLTDGALRIRFTPDPALWPRMPDGP
ncbi:ArsA-related P-loop ATPase [Streptomyces sp. NPDC051776]|uniref:ArsA family ATPase n=1 Tax=Streptomyces sp. NPDC051776 TaxID=3155414 RepID=UPI00342B2550